MTDSRTGSARRGAATEIVGFGLNAIIRLGSKLILTRLLFPVVFGLMAMMQVVMYGIWMLSDVGITQAVIASPRGDDPDFLNTAWTMQAVRGLGLWVLACVLAWPIALAMREPRLMWMLPIGTFTSVIHGFSSTRIFTLRRRVTLLPLMANDLTTQLVALAVNVAGAMHGYGVEALLSGQLISATVFTLISHNLPGVSYRNRFRWEAAARHQIVRFGRWIFFSSALSFGSARADQILLGRLLGAANLGIYNIALNLGEMPGTLILRLIDGVVYPTLSRVRHERPQDFAREYYKMRLWVDGAFHTGAGMLIAVSDVLIGVMYDARWQGAAVMLRILTLRTAASAASAVAESALMAHGRSEYSFRKNAASTAALFVLMPLGSYVGGIEGVLWASFGATCTALLVLWPAAYRLGFLRLHREALVLVYLGVGYGGGLAVAQVLASVVNALKHALHR